MRFLISIVLVVLALTSFAQQNAFSITEPIYIINGKIYDKLTGVNTDGIEKIEVLKGKEAISKYGAAAKNGAVIITTKPTFAANRGLIDPVATQLWEEKPKVIAPGKDANEAPSDAIVLFDGTDLTKWDNESGGEPKWLVKDGAMTIKPGTGAIKTKQTFGDIQLHIEWRTPAEVKRDGQDRGNSGIFFQEKYELQVLDSYENITYANGMAGSIYKQHIPLVNASRKPGEWQTFDVVFTAPRFSESGTLIIPAYITVFQNGVLIHNHVQIQGKTENQGLPVYSPHGKGSISLQDHDNAVSYRNIWVREL